MVDIRCLIIDFIAKKGNIREWIYARCPWQFDPKNFRYCITNDGITIPAWQFTEWYHIFGEYQFQDIKKDDIVIDIGANVGSFSFRAAALSDHIFAVEPLFTKELQENLRLNPEIGKKITVLEYAVGDGETINIHFQDKKKVIATRQLKDIIQSCGGCDFLKFDTEGAEWLINPTDLVGIPRIEMEIHRKRDSHFPQNTILIPYLLKNWSCTINKKKHPAIGEYYHCFPIKS